MRSWEERPQSRTSASPRTLALVVITVTGTQISSLVRVRNFRAILAPGDGRPADLRPPVRSPPHLAGGGEPPGPRRQAGPRVCLLAPAPAPPAPPREPPPRRGGGGGRRAPARGARGRPRRRRRRRGGRRPRRVLPRRAAARSGGVHRGLERAALPVVPRRRQRRPGTTG